MTLLCTRTVNTRRELGGNPSDLVLSDRSLLLNTTLWMAAVLVLIYGPWGR